MSSTTHIANVPVHIHHAITTPRVPGRRLLAGFALAVSVGTLSAMTGCDLTRDVTSCRLESLCKPSLDTPNDDPNPRPMIGH